MTHRPHLCRSPLACYSHAMLTKLSPLQSGTLGELLAVGKLNSLGHAAYISPEGAPGDDLIVVIEGQAKSVEVKTRQFLNRASEITRWPVDMEAKGMQTFSSLSSLTCGRYRRHFTY
ncbi:hypothetical protein FHS79_001839 [Polymorphobacter multimanifer]|uniref:Uncharacterized protein n=2 Tax=Polymorphobacter multimanifer TaxID=1070431 RepID=A0A841L5F7_9SPHN|nr:hypothetical protein [Polymorphobacter multimanifer]MBB6227660.1 hypothetical protein [Polymorphobacter multimanifer]